MTIQSYAVAEVETVAVEVAEMDPAEAMAAWAMSPMAPPVIEFSLKRTFRLSSAVAEMAAAAAPRFSPICKPARATFPAVELGKVVDGLRQFCRPFQA